MYATKNIQKFLDDKGIDGKEKKEIMTRCLDLSYNGIVSGGSINEIFIDPDLSFDFQNEVIFDPNHLEIARIAIQAIN